MVFNAVRIGIPALKLVAKVRLNLAMAALDNTGPKIGTLKLERAAKRRNESDRCDIILPEMSRLTKLSPIKGPQFWVQAERLSTIE